METKTYPLKNLIPAMKIIHLFFFTLIFLLAIHPSLSFARAYWEKNAEASIHCWDDQLKKEVSSQICDLQDSFYGWIPVKETLQITCHKISQFHKILISKVENNYCIKETSAYEELRLRSFFAELNSEAASCEIYQREQTPFKNIDLFFSGNNISILREFFPSLVEKFEGAIHKRLSFMAYINNGYRASKNLDFKQITDLFEGILRTIYFLPPGQNLSAMIHSSPVIIVPQNAYFLDAKFFLAEGGQRKVYRSYDFQERPVVINEMKNPDVPQVDAYILKHFPPHTPGIIHTYFSQNGWLIQEFYNSGDLFSLLESSRLNLGEAKKMAQDVAQGIEEMHKRGIIHRDLKPENILLQK